METHEAPTRDSIREIVESARYEELDKKFDSIINIQVKTTNTLEQLDANVQENQYGQENAQQEREHTADDIKDLMVIQSKPTNERSELQTSSQNFISNDISNVERTGLYQQETGYPSIVNWR